MRIFSLKLVLLATCLLAVVACEQQATVHRLSGPTMGTSWHVTATVPEGLVLGEQLVFRGIEDALEAVNASMSTYRDDSEISRFNRSPVNEWFKASPEFYRVLSSALAVGQQSDGAYDVTVGPLVNLWGFGPGGSAQEPPSADAIDQTLLSVGQDLLRLDGQGYRVIKLAEVDLDLSSIAKGYAVDKVATWLEELGIEDYLVEVGGEMRVAGTSPRGDAWRVAIEQPDAQQLAIASAVRLADTAVATSGDYRNYFVADGVRYSHSLDPRTGRPVAHELVSVTVVHPSAMLADAWATALTVMGSEQAWAVAQARGMAVYLIERDGEGFSSRHTESFGPLLEDIPETQH